MITEAAGLRWYVQDMNGNHGDGLGPDHEAEIEKLVLDLLPTAPKGFRPVFPNMGGVFLDIGAHVGHYTLRAAALGHRVIAVEANPDTAGRLLSNVVLNNLDSHVRIIPHPAWDTYESMTWNGGERIRNGSGVCRPDPAGQLWPVILDDVLGTAKQIDVVKIDTEGAELHVLRGLRATLKRCRPVMWIEDHYFLHEYETDDLLRLLDELQYDVSKGGDWSGLHYWLCRPREEGM